MRLKRLELIGFKSFAKKTPFLFESPVTAIVGPNGSGKSNAAEAFRWVLGERSLKSLRSGRGEDLIWNGGPTGAGRASRAGVTLVFDNTDRLFNVDFDEVAISREVYRDGENVYAVNGTPVRYKDLTELLSVAALGSSDHYIINQGEADRVLATNPKERRSLVEEALGLRQYQWKIAESEKKLEQTASNIERVSSLRREIAPHLRFLKKQVEKIEQADKLRAELKHAYLEYLKREELYLQRERAELDQAQAGPKSELAALETMLRASENGRDNAAESELRREREQIEARLRTLTGEKEKLDRALGRLEGLIEVKAETLKRAATVPERDYSYSEVADFVQELDRELDATSKFSDIFSLRSALGRLKETLKHFLQRGRAGDLGQAEQEAELEKWRQEQAGLANQIAGLTNEEVELQHKKSELEHKLSVALEAVRAAERELYEQKSRRQELENQLSLLSARISKLNLEETNFKRELEEAKILVNQEVALYREHVVVNAEESRDKQLERQKHLERLKIRLEDLGVDTGDTMKEYKETSERDEYLAKELVDLEQAEVGLRQMIAELVSKIDQEFRLGLVKINHQFQEFFSLMFGGGTAKLLIVEAKKKKVEVEGEMPSGEDDTDAGGIEIDITLPRKRVRGLEMLSGGERALVSIALLFALSQVNPPPFLVLDETDAALDEANSRKYGDMVENLAKHSQLILITHNRETMSRAGVIYGVTMGSDGISKLLSIKFDEAASYAK